MQNDFFKPIAPRYDAINRVISMGQDRRWRRALTKSLSLQPRMHVLDVATGTGDQLISLAHASENLQLTGIDVCEAMLIMAQEKMQRRHIAASLKAMNAQSMTYPSSHFDLITVVFGLRNFADRHAFYREAIRVLTNAGTLAVMEFSLPKNRILRGLVRFYLRHIIPLAASLLAGQRDLYAYLGSSICAMPPPIDIAAEMNDAGFNAVQIHPLFMGMVTIYLASVH